MIEQRKAVEPHRASRRGRGVFVSAGLLALCSCFARTAAGQELIVGETRWGFSGAVVPGRINPVSILLTNPARKEFDDVIAFRIRSGRNKIGADVVRREFISPGEQRWVQFYFYAPSTIKDEHEYSLQFGLSRIGDDKNLTGPGVTYGARVVLIPADDPFTARLRIPQFPDDLFPTSVGATDGLEAVILAHAPRWATSPARQQAFRDWIHAGGHVHLFQGVDGEFPEFPSELDELNSPLEDQPVGLGRVTRHAMPLAQLATNRTLQEQIAPSNADENISQNSWQFGQSMVEQRLFSMLKDVTTAYHNWPLIYTLTLAYIALIGPVHYLVSRRKLDFRLSLALLAAGVVGFSYLFLLIGGRGDGERTAVYAVSIAKPLDDGVYDVTQWGNVFSVTGARFEIRHEGEARVYSAGEAYRPSPGLILSGPDAAMFTSVPLYSDRAYMVRQRAPGPKHGATLVKWEGSVQQAREAEFTFDAQFAEKVIDAKMRYRQSVYDLTRNGARLTARSATGRPLHQFINPDGNQYNYYYGPYGRRYYTTNRSPEQTQEQIFDEHTKTNLPVLASVATWTNQPRWQSQSPTLEPDVVELLLLAEQPDSFRVANERLSNQRGRVVYRIALPVPSNRIEGSAR